MTPPSITVTAAFSYKEDSPRTFRGFFDEHALSEEKGLLYRLLVRNPKDNAFYSMKHMDEPMRPEAIDMVLCKKIYRGGVPIPIDCCVQIFDADKLLFSTRFDPNGIKVGKYKKEEVVTMISWNFN